MSKTTPQIPINNTVQVSVPPGDQTGLYYILISNLPWQTSWQQLKDHVRTVCAVERVEIFNESTSGWVSVRGRDSFNLALHFLSTELFNGRPTFADGRNAEQSIPIKKLVDTNLPDASSRSPQTSRYTTPPPLSMPYSISSPPLPTTEYGQWNTAPTYPTTTSPMMDYGSYSTSMSTASPGHSTVPPPWYSGSAPMQSSISMSPYYESASYQSPTTYYSPTGYRNTRASSHVMPSVYETQQANTVAVEWRKIVIKGLPSWAQYEHVRTLLMDRASLEADRAGFININFPARKDGSSGKRHATVTFSDERTASGIIEELNGIEVGGMTLTVEMAKEGVSEGEEHHRSRGEKRHATKKQASSSGHHSSKPHREDRDKRDSTRPSKEKESSRSYSSVTYEKTKDSSKSSQSLTSEKKDKSQAKRGVVIADGSSSRRSSESSKKTK
ncbi:hypothetical protein PG999_006141 [Apiospora kogelbergensis]|uniref:RRM domain-containing protein n=1 Tax=Apiospora kogelbergensis TaxID=1337665 RepID=A0AAW0QRB3_9PEZI